MPDLTAFSEFVDHICTRPAMYVCGGTFFEVAAYISGFDSGMDESPLRHQQDHSFNCFVAASYGYPKKIYWPFIISECSANDKDAITAVHRLLLDYVDAVKNGRDRELLAETMNKTESQPAPEQIEVWRRFSRAMHRGTKSEIEKLALDHPHLELLCNPYPDDVVPQMDKIAESYLIPLISVSDDGNTATIRTADFGTIEMKYVDGNWKIDVSPIIESQMNIQKQANTPDETNA